MKSKLALLAAYLIIAPAFILSLILYQLFLYHQDSSVSAKVLGANSLGIKYEAVQEGPLAIAAHTTTSKEARTDVLREFLSRYNSPLKDYAENIVAAADKYGLDYRLIPAIAMQESTLCLKAPKDSNNCWGFGIYGKKMTRFTDLAEGIDTVSRGIARDYYQKGLVKPAEIMTKYTPSNTGEWAENVTYVMERIASSL